MDAKICDICGATYLDPVTHREQVKNFEIKRTKFDWMLWDGRAYYTNELLNICPACSDKICEFIDTLAEENDGNHSVNSSDISDTDSIHNC